MIVVCGEALMDVFDAGATPTGQALDARIGGSPYNVAMGLARLGQPVPVTLSLVKVNPRAEVAYYGQHMLRGPGDEATERLGADQGHVPKGSVASTPLPPKVG